MLNKQAILQAQDVVFEEVDVPEWRGSVRVRNLSAGDMLKFWDLCRDKDGKVIIGKLQSSLLLYALVDENNTTLFTSDDIEELMAKSASVIAKVFEVAQCINGMGAESQNTVKNSKAAKSGDSLSA